jgi:hypothetical protein
VTVKAWLEGHQFDLEDLAQLLATGDVRVVQDTDEDGYYLTAPEIDNPPETNRFDIPAERLIVRANGLGRAKSADFRPVKFSGKCTTPDGRNLHFAAANLESRARITATSVGIGADGQPLPDSPSPWPNRFALATTHPDVAEVLDIMGSPEPLGFVELSRCTRLSWTRSNQRRSTNSGGPPNPNPRPTDYESLASASATRRNGSLQRLKSPGQSQIWPLPVRSRFVLGMGWIRPRTPRSRRDEIQPASKPAGR